ncbi:uncharacterized protein ARB_01235 [Trichophyton benhamiae CBS 112371]|uniref:Uncharacterized protein n=1 Tax=Arthroderma benhamiae (strain ATCC MYA-4681 / CBS 112371) TaxID=663331 RepID=D4AYG6_ARTBC|nr:uncharacterized protein ARB_01235 [Trichophyton benhamiae CBS 112371]EFE31982.1 hypothetical protein ARB_01235 [Trichophyton benhamiae CBS 112371]
MVVSKVDMFTEIYLNHANETIKRMVAKNEIHRISRKKIELQILEGIDNSEFPTTFRIIFYSMVLHTNTFDIYWFGQQFLHSLPDSSITQLKPKMSLLHDLEGTTTVDSLTSISSEESEASDAAESEEDLPNDNPGCATSDPTTAPSFSSINKELVNVEPTDVESPHHEEPSFHPSSPPSCSTYPTPNTTPVQKKSLTVDHMDETEDEDDCDYAAQATDFVVNDPLDDEDYFDSSYSDDSVVTAFGVQISGPRQVRTPAIFTVPKPGILKSTGPANNNRGSGPKKQTPTRPIGASKAKTGEKKGTSDKTGAGISKAKKGKGAGPKEKGNKKAKEVDLA